MNYYRDIYVFNIEVGLTQKQVLFFTTFKHTLSSQTSAMTSSWTLKPVTFPIPPEIQVILHIHLDIHYSDPNLFTLLFPKIN